VTDLCFSTMCHSAWHGIDARLPQQLRAATNAGYRLFGPDIYSLRQLQQQGISLEAFGAQIAAAGMRCFEIPALGISANRTATLAEAHELARAARVLDAEWVIVNGWSRFDLPEIPETLQQCAAILAEAGAGLAFEFMPLSPMACIADAMPFVLAARAAGARAGLLVDSWHVLRGQDGLEGLAQLQCEDIAYIQFDDALPAHGDDMQEETLNRRAMPGDGEFPLAAFCERIRATGFNGVFSVEVISAAWRERSLEEFAQASYDASRRFWA